MSALIKAGGGNDVGAVRPLEVPFRPPIDKEAPLHARIAALEAEGRQANAEMLRLRTSRDERYRQGIEAGRQAGLREAEDRAEDRLASLREAIQRAASDIADRLAATERLAALLARECLDRMFRDAEDRAGIVCGLIAGKLDEIEKSALLAVEVSTADFRDDADLAAIAKLVGEDKVSILSRDTPSGDCAFRLRLGGLELGLGQQWGVLHRLLTDMVEEGDVP